MARRLYVQTKTSTLQWLAQMRVLTQTVHHRFVGDSINRFSGNLRQNFMDPIPPGNLIDYVNMTLVGWYSCNNSRTPATIVASINGRLYPIVKKRFYVLS